MMKFYKNPNGEVFAYETEVERNEWGSPDLVEMTADEIDAHINPKPTTDQLAEQVRAVRDAKLIATNWLVERHREEQESDTTTLTVQEYTDLLAYRQALRDVPQQGGFPSNVIWPIKPT